VLGSLVVLLARSSGNVHHALCVPGADSCLACQSLWRGTPKICRGKCKCCRRRRKTRNRRHV